MPPPLSKLQQKLRDRLMGGQFRHLNERLYTQTGAESLAMVKDDPTSYAAYHDGFRKQVRAWPVNPLDLIIAECARLPAGSVVADFGCGDARLAATLAAPPGTGRLTVHSFDLHCPPGNPWVTACDMSRVPLASGTADAAVFCLSLMGTNYAEFLREADRVLKPGGLLFVAEVRSRFASADAAVGVAAAAKGPAGPPSPAPGGHARPRGPASSSTPAAEADAALESSAPKADGPGAAADGVGAFIGLIRAFDFKLLKRDEANKMFVLLFFRKRVAAAAGAAAGAAALPSHATAHRPGSAAAVRVPASAPSPAAGGGAGDGLTAGQRKRARRKKSREPPLAAESTAAAVSVAPPPVPAAAAASDPAAAPRPKKRRRRGGHNISSSPSAAAAAAAGVPAHLRLPGPRPSAPGVLRDAAAAGEAPAATAPRPLPAAPQLKACAYKKR